MTPLDKGGSRNGHSCSLLASILRCPYVSPSGAQGGEALFSRDA